VLRQKNSNEPTSDKEGKPASDVAQIGPSLEVKIAGARRKGVIWKRAAAARENLQKKRERRDSDPSRPALGSTKRRLLETLIVAGVREKMKDLKR